MATSDRPTLRVLGLAGSPRPNGNTTRLLDAFLAGAADGGAQTELARLADLRIAPCRACETCYEAGDCCIVDDAQTLYGKLLTSDVIVLATPIYFYGVTTHAKLLIDRCQALWARQAKLHRPPPKTRARGVLLSAAASGGARLFDGAILTVRYWMDTFYADLAACRLYRHFDETEDAARHPTALSDVRALGARMAEEQGYREEIAHDQAGSGSAGA
jgi:multimeric flavodoxin WrbA